MIMIVAIAGCGGNSAVAGELKEVNRQELSSGAQSFAGQIKDKNGLYLYSPADEQGYLIVNYATVSQGEEAKFMASVKTEMQGQSLSINVEELGTEDYSDKRLGKMRFFELDGSQEYKVIQIYKNGTATGFDSVGG
jgi:repressor of nif and glnA expression